MQSEVTSYGGHFFNFHIILTWFISLRKHDNVVFFLSHLRIDYRYCKSNSVGLQKGTQWMKYKETESLASGYCYTFWLVFRGTIFDIFTHASLGFWGQANNLDQMHGQEESPQPKPKYYFKDIQYLGTSKTANMSASVLAVHHPQWQQVACKNPSLPPSG